MAIDSTIGTAVMGSLGGGLASLGSTWFTQHYQGWRDYRDDGRAVLLELLAGLPSEQMQVLLLTHMASTSQREIFRRLGVTLGVAKHH